METAGPYSVFLQSAYGTETGEANFPAACSCVLGAGGFATLVLVGFNGNLLLLFIGMLTSVLALIFGAYGMNTAEWAGRGRAGAIVGLSLGGLAILCSTSLAVFAIWQTP